MRANSTFRAPASGCSLPSNSCSCTAVRSRSRAGRARAARSSLRCRGASRAPVRRARWSCSTRSGTRSFLAYGLREGGYRVRPAATIDEVAAIADAESDRRAGRQHRSARPRSGGAAARLRRQTRRFRSSPSQANTPRASARRPPSPAPSSPATSWPHSNG